MAGGLGDELWVDLFRFEGRYIGWCRICENWQIESPVDAITWAQEIRSNFEYAFNATELDHLRECARTNLDAFLALEPGPRSTYGHIFTDTGRQHTRCNRVQSTQADLERIGQSEASEQICPECAAVLGS